MLAKKQKGAVEKRKKTSNLSSFLWMLLGAILTLMIGVFLYLSPVFNFSPTNEASSAASERQVQPKVNTDTDNGDYEFYDVLPNQEMATIPDETVAVQSDASSVPDTFEPDVVVLVPAEQPRQNASGNAATDGSGTDDGSTDSNDDNQIVVVEDNVTYEGARVDSSGNDQEAIANNTATQSTQQSTAEVEQAQPNAAYILQINSFSSPDEADRRRAQVLMAGVDATVVKKTTANGQPLYQVISRTMNNRQAVVMAQQRLQNNGIDSLIVEQRR